jgi:uncharacterized protein YjbK
MASNPTFPHDTNIFALHISSGGFNQRRKKKKYLLTSKKPTKTGKGDILGNTGPEMMPN